MKAYGGVDVWMMETDENKRLLRKKYTVHC
jgi:hypothetical protein